ncbi:Transposase [Micromonospora lupini str. Lupac 08]|uniref:Transposase n=1 Tax=Micromonospora lupini str. Lupac 08 TaxID=1150864 RepID=I0L7J3_9ACTN|nr:Transposase [Micromonospora lupini str. Lupac 08]
MFVGPTVTDVDVDRWHGELDRLHARIGPRFRRSEPRLRVRQYLCGLVSGLGRKNGWTLAEQAGDASPDGMQRLLRWADWDVDAVRDDVRDYVVEHLGDPAGVLIVDDTGFLKKGTRSAGVQRQYSGTAGRTENCQVGAFLAYRSAKGHALIDRQLYLPASWTDDRDRCRAAGIPDAVQFATKVQMAREMLARALDAGVPVGWVTMDEAYGQSESLRVWLEHRDVGYVVATRRNDDMITTTMGTCRADKLIAALPARAWCRPVRRRGRPRPARVLVGAGAGADLLATRPGPLAPGPAQHDHRGDRLLRLLRTPPHPTARPGPHRGSPLGDRGVFPAGQERSRPRRIPGPRLASLVRPHHPVHGRSRLAVRGPIPYRKRGSSPGDDMMIGYTVPEIRRLLTALIVRSTHPPEHVWAWSRWRRRRQHQARTCHYRRHGYP